MPAFSKRHHLLSSVASLGYCNPFLPDRVALEKAVLGREFVAGGPVWSASVTDPEAMPPNVTSIYAKLGEHIEELHARLADASEVSAEELTIYEESVHYLLYERYHGDFVSAQGKWRFYREFLADWNRLYRIPGKRFESALEPAHVFVCFRQIQRAFHHIYDNIIGNSMPAAELRASVWQSIFIYDMRRYRHTLYRKMAQFPTLITGLRARARS